jgi:hypothetical protein
MKNKSAFQKAAHASLYKNIWDILSRFGNLTEDLLCCAKEALRASFAQHNMHFV